jgi:hypothetical protein
VPSVVSVTLTFSGPVIENTAPAFATSGLPVFVLFFRIRSAPSW